MSTLQDRFNKCVDGMNDAFLNEEGGTLSRAKWFYSYFGLIDQDDGGGNNINLDRVQETLRGLGYQEKIDNSSHTLKRDDSLEVKVEYLADQLLSGNASPILGSVITIDDLQRAEL
ncbi:MAG: hypothetical protein ACRBCK_06370 [Alphaproteobacteria bacterium]